MASAVECGARSLGRGAVSGRHEHVYAGRVPLFIDRHDSPGASPEDVAADHMKDLAVQEQFGVRYYTYWFDRAVGTKSGGLFNVDTAGISSWEKTGPLDVTVHFKHKSPFFFYLFIGIPPEIVDGFGRFEFQLQRPPTVVPL